MAHSGEAWAFETRYPLFARVALVSVWLLGFLAAYEGIYQGLTDGNLGNDAHAYWLAVQSGLTYERVPGQDDAFLYSPAFAQVITPLGWLPYPAFLTVWIAINIAVLVWLLAHVRLRWAVPLFLLCVPELVIGNVFILLAGCMAAGLRHPALWSFPILTKVTTGVGLLWFAFRREWRPLLVALGATVAVVCVSAVLDPSAWTAWLTFLLTNTDGSRDGRNAFVIRVVIAVLLMWWSARSGRAWMIAVAMVVAAPVTNVLTFMMLVAIPRLAEQSVLPVRLSGDARPTQT